MSDEPDIHELIERSSLGTPEAKAVRATVSDEQVRRIVRRSRELHIRDALGDIYDPEGVEIVMRSRNTMLDNRSPNDLLDAREFARLDEWVAWLSEGPSS